jgi:hypothetical protein
MLPRVLIASIVYYGTMSSTTGLLIGYQQVNKLAVSYG